MKNLGIIIATGLILFSTACSTDFDINADWKDITVVYGLLNPADSAQYIKVNKAFLGDLDAYVMAAEKDSIYYEDAEVFLVPEVNGQMQNSQKITLFETTEIPKDSGIFFYDTNILYKTSQSLTGSNNYYLIVLIPGKDTVSSYTKLISDLSISSPSSTPQIKVSFANFFGYTDFRAVIGLNPNGSMYGLQIDFRYLEVRNDGQEMKKLEWHQISKRKDFVAGSQYNELEWAVSGAEFYWFISQQVKQDPEVLYREFVGVDFHFTVAGEDLVSYIETNGPSQGIVQERPFFSNINNGIGVFASRFNKSVPNKLISDFSIDRLSCDSLTRPLRFLNAAGKLDDCNF